MKYRFVTGMLAGIFLMCMTLSFYGLDPHRKITQYIHDAWGIEQGLPQSSIYAVTQTADGYIWVGTEEGLARFDGVRFKSYKKQFSNNWITVLYQDREENFWIGTHGGGLIRFENETCHAYTTADGLAHNVVWTLYEDPAKNLWIGTDGGLSRMKNGKITTYTTEGGLSHNVVRPIAGDREGNLWVGTYGGGLNRMENGTFTVYTTADGLSNNMVSALLTDRRGDLWVGTEGGGLDCLRKGKPPFRNYTVKDGLGADGIRALYEDREGNLWIGTQGGGLSRLQKGTFSTITKKQGLSDDFIFSFHEDSEGSLWAGSWGGGLNRLKNGKFTLYNTHGGLSNDMVLSIYEDRKGYLWFSTDGGLNRMDPADGTFTLYSMQNGLSSNLVVCVCEGRGGRLWIGTDGGGLNCIEDGAITSYTDRQGLSHGIIRALHEDREGSLWIGTWGGGLNRLKNGKFSVYTMGNGLSDNKVRHIFQDRKGDLWIGADDGLSRLDYRDLKSGNIAFTAFTTKNGLSGNIVRTIYEDREGDLWIGTYGSGLNRLKNGVFTPVTEAAGLFSNVVLHIIPDHKDNLWMSSNKGVFQVPLGELKDFCDGKRKRIQCTYYDDGDGMKSKECNGIGQPSSLKDRTGKLWFPTKKGAVMLDPDNIKINRLPPPVKIEKITADTVEIHPPSTAKGVKGETLVIAPGTERFEIEYTGLSFLAPGKVRFRCKLDGFDREWQSVGTRRTAYYTKLPAGDYTFRVTACNNDGIWNKTGASVSFYLRPFFYETWWFYLLCVLVGGFLVIGAYRLRLRRVRRHEEELERLVAQRTRELQKANDLAQAANRAKGEFLARMSHEIRTPLNSVVGFSDMLTGTSLNPEQADYTESINRSGEALIAIVDDILDFSRIEAGKLTFSPVDFSPGITVSGVCRLIRPRIGQRRIEIQYEVGRRVPPYVKHDEGRFRQVLVNLMSNAVKFTEEGEIVLGIDVEEEDREKNRLKLHVTVFDTGIGIPPDKLDSIFDVFHQADGTITRRYGGTGLGLAISKQIAKHMDGDIWVESEPGKGSTFHFTAWTEMSDKTTAKEKEKKEKQDTFLPAYILLVEDNPLNRKLVRAMLTKAGYPLDIVENGREAVERYAANPGKYDLILMDIQMPEMDGREATKAIRKIEAGGESPTARHIPIVAMTAESMKGDMEKCLEAGMDDYISKPIRRETVFEIIKKWKILPALAIFFYLF